MMQQIEMIVYDESDLQAGILCGIKKDNCYLVSTWCPPSERGKNAAMKSFLTTYAKGVTTEADFKKNPAVIRTMALGRVAFKRLGLKEPFKEDQNEFVENFLYANSLADRPRFKVGNEYCVLLQLWCDDADRAAVEEEIELIRSSLKNEGLFSERFFKTVHVRRKTRAITYPGGEKKVRSIGPLGFVEGAGNPKLKEEVAACCLMESEIGVGSIMAFLNCRVNKELFDVTARKLAARIFRHDKEEEIPEKELNYGKAQLMGQFWDESNNFTTKGASVNPAIDPPIPDAGYCPFGAHAKLTREVTEKGPDADPEKRIVRRGIAYEYSERVDDLYTNTYGQKKTNHGLYFISYQRSINEQFIPLLRRMQHNDLVMYHKAARSPQEEPRTQSPFHARRGLPEAFELNESDLKFLTILSEGYYFVPGKAYLTGLTANG